MSFRPDPNDVRTRLYRDPEQGIILGVCAGLAGSFGVPAWLARAAALGLGWCWPEPVIVAYLVAALLLPQRPLRYAGPGDEANFWRSRRRGA